MRNMKQNMKTTNDERHEVDFLYKMSVVPIPLILK
jgi:hypothetical protein